MKHPGLLPFLLFSGLFWNICSGQTNCSAAFLNNKIVVDEYTTTGKCMLPIGATGRMNVCTADLSPTRSIPLDKVRFMIAIRHRHTKTLTMYSKEAYKEVDIEKVLSACKPGDHIVLLTMNKEFALPHNEILVQ